MPLVVVDGRIEQWIMEYYLGFMVQLAIQPNAYAGYILTAVLAHYTDMDEPFAALDAQTRLTLQHELLSLWGLSHCNVVFVTHDVDEAILLGDRILVMSPQPGKIIAQYKVPFDRPRSPATALAAEFLELKSELFEMLGVSYKEPAHVSYGQ